MQNINTYIDGLDFSHETQREQEEYIREQDFLQKEQFSRISLKIRKSFIQ